MNFVRILGVNFPINSREDLLKKALELLKDAKFSQIVTPNPEILLLADKDDEYMEVLRRANLLLPDGFGLVLAAKFKGKNLERLTGSDLLPKLLVAAEKNNQKVACLIWNKGLSTVYDVQAALKRQYPNLQVKVWAIERGGLIPEDLSSWSADLALVGLGAPWQDKLAYYLKENGLAKLSVGVGGSFDFVSGRIKRAPKIISRCGLEWLWRLSKQPSRINRIYNAVVKFLMVFCRQELINRWLYRPNVIGFILNKRGRVLIVNSNKEPGRNFWKLPQGGRDYGESEEVAIRREMQEELNLIDLEILAFHKNIFQYDWPAGYSIRGFKGQRQSLFIMKYSGEDTDVQLNIENKDYAWVEPSELLEATSQVTREAYTKILEKYKEIK